MTGHIHHSTRHLALSYPVSLWQRVYSAFTPLVLLVLLFVVLRATSLFPIISSGPITLGEICLALFATFVRLLIAYLCAIVLAIPLAVLANKSSTAERIFLPIFDIAQSVPALAFFPIVILLFAKLGFIEGAAIFIIFISMLWEIVFSLVGGIKVIPSDIKEAAQVFGVKDWFYFKQILIPGIVPYLITGSLLAWAEGWNITIVAEVLHTYLPGGTASQDLFGIGNILVKTAADGQNETFITAIFVMVTTIALINFFVWQKLLHYAEKYKFE